MLTINPLKTRLRQGKPVYGLLNSVPGPWLAEMIGRAGYDFVILDMEHLLVSEETLRHSLQAVLLTGCTPLVRVPGVDAKLIGRLLDAGARGIVLPQADSADTVARAITACRFPPLGCRGITGGPITGFGTLPLDEYIRLANDNIMVVPMIESRAGIDALPGILALDGVDMVLEGALDLALNMGLGPSPQHPQVEQAIGQLAAQCLDAGVPFCANPRSPEQTARWRQAGITTWLAGEDRGYLFRALADRLFALRQDI
ncbi:HpcH/HpaI aldolase family protein [Oceanisphaera arctica]|uniref:4-hydroxy-2-oxovalerate aldolase n=1 Tax=Oceanisphaera arctica TaxID=641510 RepID=A0A2P5TIL5_9GAMM|nr:aldolase/citrate lyase family protein [Oceanisphaera arctica]PPL14638.1 4-hydroxy-2-oxovalerate aldolase [Oceanisphaera arctica]GHA03574.1 4-hydroxy-2-oxovalerate aldolase [Oceanisphaera arctica]